MSIIFFLKYKCLFIVMQIFAILFIVKKLCSSKYTIINYTIYQNMMCRDIQQCIAIDFPIAYSKFFTKAITSIEMIIVKMLKRNTS